MPSKRQLAAENKILKGQVQDARELLRFSVKTSEMGLLALAERLPMTEEDLETLTKEFPQWSVSCETVESGFDDENRKIIKRFTRNMGDLRPDLQKDRGTYLRFWDGEFFDDGVRDALSMGDDDLGYISGGGSIGRGSDGFFAYITMDIENESSITKLDLIRIKAAEQYLQRENLFAEPVAA